MTPTTADGIPAIFWLLASIVGVAVSVALRFESFPLDTIVRLAVSGMALFASVKWMTRCERVPAYPAR